VPIFKKKTDISNKQPNEAAQTPRTTRTRLNPKLADGEKS
jgi:hypothetical protein